MLLLVVGVLISAASLVSLFLSFRGEGMRFFSLERLRKKSLKERDNELPSEEEVMRELSLIENAKLGYLANLLSYGYASHVTRGLLDLSAGEEEKSLLLEKTMRRRRGRKSPVFGLEDAVSFFGVVLLALMAAVLYWLNSGSGS